MRSLSVPGWVREFFIRQQQFLAVAMAIYAAFWALHLEVDVIVVLIYTLCLSNMTAWMQDAVSGWQAKTSARKFWSAYLGLLILLTPVMIAISNLLVRPLMAPNLSFWEFMKAGWKFPAVVTLMFGIASQVYRWTEARLTSENYELQRTVQRETAQRELQDQDLERAREIQQGLLPKQMPQIAGFEIAGASEPARVVGGDYFDVIRLSDTRLGLCIADVVGKGVSAALLMANVQATVRAFASDTASPSWLCSRVNSVLCANIASGKFVTLFYGVLDAEKQSLRYANAGHLYPVLLRGEEHVERLDHGGALLGVLPDWKYDDAVVPLASGDRLLLFTDGITEAASGDGTEFGELRLIDAALQAKGRAAAELNAHMLVQVRQFCDSQLQDDATIIVVRVT